MAIGHPNCKWRFLARKIIERVGWFSRVLHVFRPSKDRGSSHLVVGNPRRSPFRGFIRCINGSSRSRQLPTAWLSYISYSSSSSSSSSVYIIPLPISSKNLGPRGPKNRVFLALNTSNLSDTKTRASKNLKPASRKMPQKSKNKEIYHGGGGP